MDFLFDFVFQIFGGFLVELGFRGVAAVVQSRIGRYAAPAIAGGMAGAAWGAHLSQPGRVQEPKTLWISLLLAGLTGALAVFRAIRQRDDPSDTGDERPLSPPWRWPVYRCLGFVVLNVAVAVGVAIGFTPHSPLR